MAEQKDPFDKIKKSYGVGKKPKGDLAGYVFNKVQPQARLMEEAVLGSMMMDKEAVSEVIDILEPNSFYVDAHQIIYKAMKDLFADSKPIDLLTVSDKLRKMGKMEQIGGAFYLSKLTNTVASTANIEAHARIIAEKYIKRELIRTSNEIIKDAFEETNDALELLEKAQRDLFGIAQGNIRRNYDSMGNLLTKALAQIEEVSKNTEGVTGVPSGFIQLDAVTAGWQRSDLIIMAARPGMGKTSFVLALARNAAVEFKKPIAVFSLEMSSVQLVQRLISSEAEIPSEKLRKGTLAGHEWAQLTSKMNNLSEAPIYIDDTPGINIFELRAKCRRLKMNHDIQMIVIDYLQLMTGSSDGKGGNREQEISNISRSLKGIAKELNIPVIALSQLSRAVEQRGGLKKPQLSDLRECITADTEIYLPEQGIYKSVGELLKEGAGFKVLSMNPDHRLEPALCLDIWETGEKEIYELETQSGYKIKTSANHPFYTINGWSALENLKEGSHIACARETVNNTFSSLKNEELILLAHMIGDGCYVEGQAIHYTSQDAESRDIVAACAKKLWDIDARFVKDKQSNNCYHVYLPSPYPLAKGKHHPFINLLKSIGLNKARSFQKILADEIMKCDNEQLSLFLNHLWATDGGIFIRKGKGSHKIHYSSNSEKLIKQLKSLLLRFSIQASIQKSQKEGYLPQFSLNITGKENLLKFADHIGIFGSKRQLLSELVNLINNIDSIPNSDIIPRALWQEIKALKKSEGFTERSFQTALESNYCGSSFYKPNISRSRLQKVADVLENEYLENLANSDLKWEKIKSIKKLGSAPTYDLHIEGLHNFVANDFIIHNSGAIEQDADMVVFLYRPEYYGFDQDEDGNPTQGLAEVIIAKHRNGSLETIKTRFIGKYTKFVDLDTFGGMNNFDTYPSAANTDFGMSGTSEPNTGFISLGSKMNNPPPPPPPGSYDDEDIPF